MRVCVACVCACMRSVCMCVYVRVCVIFIAVQKLKTTIKNFNISLTFH